MEYSKEDKRKLKIYYIICFFSVILMILLLLTEDCWANLEDSHPFIFSLMFIYAFPLGGLWMWIMVYFFVSAEDIYKKYLKLENEKSKEEKIRKIIREEFNKYER